MSLSAKANALHQRIDEQDVLYVRAVAAGAPAQLLARIREVRNGLSRDWGAEILRQQFEAHDRVGA